MEKQRLTAFKTRIGPVISGTYVKQEGFEPNYVSAGGRRLSRVRIMGTVVGTFASPKISSATIDDGTGTIRAKAFGSRMMEKYRNGDVIEIIGKIRQSQDEEIFIIPETARKIEDMNRIILRELELRENEAAESQKKKIISEIKKEAADIEELKALSRQKGIPEEEAEELAAAQEVKDTGASRQAVLKIIEENSTEEGCDYSTLIEKSGLEEEELDRAISEVLEEGICFEPKPGKIKKL